MSMRPVPEMYPISQSYYGTFSNQFQGGAVHGAIDFAVPAGTPVLAPDDGTVVHADWAWNLPGGPNDWASRWYLIKPASGDTKGGGGIITTLRNDLGSIWYAAHLSDNNMVKVGQRVKAGDVIGLSGSTGIATGDHLHLGLIPPNPDVSNGAYGAIDPAPFLTEKYAPNKAVSWSGGATKGTGSAAKPTTVPAAADLWMPGATRSPQPGAVTLDTSLPARVTWHITSDVDPGKQQPAFTRSATYLKNQQYCPHLMWDPFTGQIEQYYPANVGARALKAWNEDGRRHIQIEILFSRGAVRDGRQYWELADTPLKGFAQIVQWLDSHGIPRTWPMGPTPPIGQSGTRDVGIWNSKAGHYGHSQVPGNDHTDPGTFPDITKIPTVATGAAAAVTTAGDDLLEGLLTMDQATFDRERKIPGRPAWYLTNGRDHSANLTVAVKALTALVKGIPASVLQAKVTRKGTGAAGTVTQAEALAYEKDNWTTDRAKQDAIFAEQKKTNELLGRLVTALEEKN